MNALNNFSLLSLDRNLDTRVMALICLDARVHIVEICLWKVNLLSIKMPSSLTHSLGAKYWPWTFIITGSLQWPAFMMIVWNFDDVIMRQPRKIILWEFTKSTQFLRRHWIVTWEGIQAGFITVRHGVSRSPNLHGPGLLIGVKVTMICQSIGSLLGTPKSLHIGTLLVKCP